MHITKLLLLVFLLGVISCEKIHYYPDRENTGSLQTRILAHKAGGECGFTPNTLDAVRYGLKHEDGIEVDVQISANNTVWLRHDYKLPSCGSYFSTCFRETTDEQVAEIDSCLGKQDDFTTLEEVFKLMADSFPNSYISIDAKAWLPCDAKNGDMIGELNVVAEKIIKLKNKYKLTHVMVESETATFLAYVKKHSSGIECYLTTFGDFDRGMLIALDKGFQGLSFQYKFRDEITRDHIRLLHKKGLKIQLWTLADENYYQEALSIGPDFIQTDLCDSSGP